MVVVSQPHLGQLLCSALWFQMWAACVSPPVGGSRHGSLQFYLESGRKTLLQRQERSPPGLEGWGPLRLAMGPSRCIWEGESDSQVSLSRWHRGQTACHPWAPGRAGMNLGSSQERHPGLTSSSVLLLGVSQRQHVGSICCRMTGCHFQA